MSLFGCDTFVVLPPLTFGGDIVFGKNSDRPQGEVQEVIFVPSKTFKKDQPLQCTYINVNQVPSTYAVLLSKPAWMWGAEMGANSCGVVIGNEAVWGHVVDDTETERLLGMDLLRLSLERSSSSSEAVTTIAHLLEKHGQGGACSDIDSDLFYYNSFLIADQNEAWVLETAGKLWAAEKLTTGYRNISNCLSIGTNITLMSNKLLAYSKEHKLWSGQGEFNFKESFSNGGSGCMRETAGRKLLRDLTTDKQFDAERMFQVLRDKPSGICRPTDDPFHTSGSWASVLSAQKPDCHWVTGTPDPSISLFKPFIFSEFSKSSPHTKSPVYENDPAKLLPRFQFEVDRKHNLYKLHEKVLTNVNIVDSLKILENSIFKDVKNRLASVESCEKYFKSCIDIFENSVESEVNLYSELDKK